MLVVLSFYEPAQVLHLHTWWWSLAATCAGGIFPSAIGTNTPCTGGGVTLCNLCWWSYIYNYIYLLYLYIYIYIYLSIYIDIYNFLHFSFSESYYPDIWISTPPLLIEDTSLTVYFCSYSSFFYHAFVFGTSATIMAAIREANTSSTWYYTESFISCYEYECMSLYYQNFTNSLVALHMFTSLKPNTLYSLELLGCYLRYDTCTVGDSYFRYSVNITTRPGGE